MENEDNIINLANFYGGVSSRIATPETAFNEFSNNKEIDIPEKLKDVVKKMCPEIVDIVSAGYREQMVYNPMDFSPIYKFLVGIDVYFDDHNGMKKSKDGYGKEFNDYFKMTYGSEMEFITFHVQSFIFPPEKTNKDKFFELFGKVKTI
jgi:hypothetical protein